MSVTLETEMQEQEGSTLVTLLKKKYSADQLKKWGWLAQYTGRFYNENK